MDAIILHEANPPVGMKLRKSTRRPSRPPAHLSPPARRRFRVDRSAGRADGGRHRILRARLRRRQGTAIKVGAGPVVATSQDTAWIPLRSPRWAPRPRERTPRKGATPLKNPAGCGVDMLILGQGPRRVDTWPRWREGVGQGSLGEPNAAVPATPSICGCPRI